MFGALSVASSEAVSAPLPPVPPALPSLPALPPAPTVEYGKAPKLFTCPICSKAIKGRRNNLTRHMADVHSDAKKAECGLCGQRFKHALLAKHAKECQGLTSAPLAASTDPSPTPTPTADEATSAALCPPSLTLTPTVAPSAADSASPAAARSSLTIAVIDAAAADFLAWLQEPVLPTEHMVRKVATPRALTQLKEGLRQVVREVDKEMPRLFAGGVQLRLLVVPDVVSALVKAMQRRGVQASTIYPIALLLKKVCVWLCSRQSKATKTYIAPDTMAGWPLICQHCSQTTKKRKQDHLARRLRGTDEDKYMTSEEKNVLLSACLRVLQETRQNLPMMNFGFSYSDYTDHFIVALLLLGLAPRQQTFRELTTDMIRPPGSDSRTPEQYVIDGQHGKTAMVYYCAIHPVLTSSMKFYLRCVLGTGYNGPLFVQMGGMARQDFSLITRKLTKQYVGRSITASKFRMTVATDLLGKPGVKSRALADIMGHTEAVQQSWYVGTRMAEDARACQDALLQGVTVPHGMMA